MSTPRRDAGDAAAGAAGLSAEEVEALRQMHEEVSRQLPDRRSEGDSQWLANGAQVELHSLQKAQQLNGQRGEIVGFDDKQLRYRVRLHSDNSVKVVAKKNMRLLTYEDLQLPDVPDTARTAGLATAGSSTASGTPPAAPVTREVVVKAIDRVKRDVLALQQRIAVRRAGGTAEATPDMSDIFMRLTASEEMCKEVMEMYQRSHGRDEELDLHAATALEASEACVQEYTEVRSWQEYFQDEVNVTKYNVQKHGILGTLKNEVVEVGQDVRDLGQSAKEVIGTHAPQVPHLVRKATGTVSEAVQSGTAAATSTGRSFAARSQEHITNVVHESVVAPVKRAWHFLVFGFLLCFLVPLFALRTYAPFNTVVSNMGVLWLAVCTCCPPRGMHRRAAKAALILLYPLVTVALPLGLHYWATHPQFAEDVSSALRQLPSAVTRTVRSVRPNHCDAPPEPKVLPAAPAAAPAAPAPVPPAAAAERKEVEEDTDRNPKPGFLRWLTTLFHRFHPKPRQTAFVPAVGYTGQWATIQHPRPRRLRRNTIFEHESRGNGIGQ